MSKNSKESSVDELYDLENNLDNNYVNEKWLEIKNIKRNYWKPEEEELLREWADKAQCYEWMHFKTHEKYKRQNIWFTIPVIVISTITGTANFAQERFGDKYKDYVIMSVGSANIIAGIITTIYQYLKISELNENHKHAYIEWGKLYRNIKTEIKKHPYDRENHFLFMNYCKKEFEKLINSSPSIPKDIVKIFNNKHRKSNISKPEICSSVVKTDIFELSDELRQEMINELNIDSKKIEEEKEKNMHKLHSDYEKLQFEYQILHEEMQKLKAQNQNQEVKEVKVDLQLEKFKKSFYQLNGRHPTNEEIKSLYNDLNLNNNFNNDLNDENEKLILNNDLNNDIHI